MNDNMVHLVRDLAALPLGHELMGDYPDSAHNETLDEFIKRAREIATPSSNPTTCGECGGRKANPSPL